MDSGVNAPADAVYFNSNPVTAFYCRHIWFLAPLACRIFTLLGGGTQKSSGGGLPPRTFFFRPEEVCHTHKGNRWNLFFTFWGPLPRAPMTKGGDGGRANQHCPIVFGGGNIFFVRGGKKNCWLEKKFVG